MAVSEADVQELAQALLGRNVAPEFLEQYMEFENPAAVYDAMYNSAEGANYRETGIAASLDNPGVLPTAPTADNNTGGGDQGSQAVTAAQVQALYQELLGRQGANENVMNWVNSGMSIDEIRSAIAGSPEGLNYAQYGIAASLDNPGVLPTGDATVDGTTNFNPLIQQYYQELFNRQAQQPGLDYFSGRLSSGDLTEDTLRDAIIAGAQGSDRLYYDASQSGGPVFDATQALFGRRPARGTYNPETGQLEGGYGAYRSRLDAGELTPEQLRGRLVQLAYDRGEGGGQSADYQAYLNTLRSSLPEGAVYAGGSPFFDEATGTYKNIPYGSDLSQPDTGMPAPPPPGGGQFPGGGFPPVPPNIPGGGLGKGGGMPTRMPGQYITGNQLYSGMPYGMSQPMGMFMPRQPFNYGYSSQYMPNRGLMSGYSTGFGPYGGYQRPMGGKGGMMRPRPRFGYGGKGGY